MQSFQAEVVDVREQSRTAGQIRWQLLLDRSDFTLGSAGTLEATARSGVRLTLPVLAVQLDANGNLWHAVEKPLAAGTAVTCVVFTPAPSS